MKLDRNIIWPLAIALMVFIASGQSSLATPKTGFPSDKVFHFLIFGLLATSIIRIPYFLKQHWKGVLATVLIVSAYGILDEFRQMFTEGRSVELKDWIADTTGATVAAILYFKWIWYRSILERHLSGNRKSVTEAHG